MAENLEEEKIQKMIDELVAKAKKASEEYLKLDQEQVNNIVKAMSMAGLEHHMELAKIALEETGRGIRTRMSDDLLWLVYLTCEYIEFTGDMSILNEKTPYLVGKELEENEDERYDKFEYTKETGSIYEHCIKAIERSLNFGENGLPKIGSGDWNDGFSNVGPKGKGESVWLGFFLYNVLDRFTKIMEQIKDDLLENEATIENKIEKYKLIMQQLKRALNSNGWDGRWYKRAFMDDGNTLGSMENDECRIDSIAQSWSTI